MHSCVRVQAVSAAVFPLDSPFSSLYKSHTRVIIFGSTSSPKTVNPRSCSHLRCTKSCQRPSCRREPSSSEFITLKAPLPKLSSSLDSRFHVLRCVSVTFTARSSLRCFRLCPQTQPPPPIPIYSPVSILAVLSASSLVLGPTHSIPTLPDLSLPLKYRRRSSSSSSVIFFSVSFRSSSVHPKMPSVILVPSPS